MCSQLELYSMILGYSEDIYKNLLRESLKYFVQNINGQGKDNRFGLIVADGDESLQIAQL